MSSYDSLISRENKEGFRLLWDFVKSLCLVVISGWFLYYTSAPWFIWCAFVAILF